jgi:hypothetical protein
MNSYKQYFLVVLSVALASCASSSGTSAETVASANDDGVICEKEAKVGSRLGKMVCTTRAEREEAMRITQEQRRTRLRTRSGTDEAAGDVSVGN